MIQVQYTYVFNPQTKEESHLELIIMDLDLTSIFPPSLKVKSNTSYGYDYDENGKMTGTYKRIFTRIFALFESNGVNQGKNESGKKRLQKFIKILESEYSEIEYIESGNNKACSNTFHNLPNWLFE